MEYKQQMFYVIYYNNFNWVLEKSPFFNVAKEKKQISVVKTSILLCGK